MTYHTFSPELATRFLKRLKGTEGNVKEAAKSLGVSYDTIRNWRHRDKEFDRQCREVLRAAREQQA